MLPSKLPARCLTLGFGTCCGAVSKRKSGVSFRAGRGMITVYHGDVAVAAAAELGLDAFGLGLVEGEDRDR